MQELVELVKYLGFPAAIAIYLIWYTTQRLNHSLDEIKALLRELVAKS